jgi:hypothetical protein
MKGRINAVSAIRGTDGSPQRAAYYHRAMRTLPAKPLLLGAALCAGMLYVGILCIGAPAYAADYPVSGNWTYEHATEKGPAKECGKRHMRFAGNLRYDTGSGAPEYKNVSAVQNGQESWRVVDEFFTGMIRGRVTYTLRAIDADHLELHFDRGGNTTLLRRCP